MRRGKAAEPPVETAAHADERRVIAEAVAQGCAAHVVLREEAQREREAAAATAYAKTYIPTPRLKAAPAQAPTVELSAILTSAGVEWQRGNTLALDLADWILRMEHGWSYAVGADLWVWVTLREGDRFATDVERVERLLSVLTDSAPQQAGKSYQQVPRGGKVDPVAAAQGATLDVQRWAKRCVREGLTYGAGSALAWGAASPWHYVMRSRRCQAFVGDDLIGYALTIAPTPAGAALAAWAEAYAQDALREPAEAAEGVQPQDRLSGWAARLKERRALWRAYKTRTGVGADGWQVGF